jgi:hypothetical protein
VFDRSVLACMYSEPTVWTWKESDPRRSDVESMTAVGAEAFVCACWLHAR